MYISSCVCLIYCLLLTQPCNSPVWTCICFILFHVLKSIIWLSLKNGHCCHQMIIGVLYRNAAHWKNRSCYPYILVLLSHLAFKCHRKNSHGVVLSVHSPPPHTTCLRSSINCVKLIYLYWEVQHRFTYCVCNQKKNAEKKWTRMSFLWCFHFYVHAVFWKPVSRTVRQTCVFRLSIPVLMASSVFRVFLHVFFKFRDMSRLRDSC